MIQGSSKMSKNSSVTDNRGTTFVSSASAGRRPDPFAARRFRTEGLYRPAAVELREPSRADRMEDAVAEAIAPAASRGRGGDGCGKSFAYLVPAILAAGQQPPTESGRRSSSARTRSAPQEQLIGTGHSCSSNGGAADRVLPAVAGEGREQLRQAAGGCRGAGGAVEHPLRQGGGDRPARAPGLEPAGSTGASRISTSGPSARITEVRGRARATASKAVPDVMTTVFYYKARYGGSGTADFAGGEPRPVLLRSRGSAAKGASVFRNTTSRSSAAEAHMGWKGWRGTTSGVSVTSGQANYLFNKLYNDRTQKGLPLAPQP